MRNVGVIALALVGLGGLFVPSQATAGEVEPSAPVIRYSVVPNRPVEGSLWLPATPNIAVWEDGRFIAHDPVLRRGEWLLPQLVEGSVDPSVVADLLVRADADGLVADGGDYGQMLDYGPHAPMTEVVIRDGEPEWVHTAYALHLDSSEAGDRGVLADFIAEVASLQTADATDVTPWVPDAIAIRAVPAASGDEARDAVDWPASGPALRESDDCQVLSDPASIAVVQDSLASTRFASGGQEWQLAARPVLPGIAPC